MPLLNVNGDSSNWCCISLHAFSFRKMSRCCTEIVSEFFSTFFCMKYLGLNPTLVYKLQEMKYMMHRISIMVYFNVIVNSGYTHQVLYHMQVRRMHGIKDIHYTDVSRLMPDVFQLDVIGQSLPTWCKASITTSWHLPMECRTTSVFFFMSVSVFAGYV